MLHLELVIGAARLLALAGSTVMRLVLLASAGFADAHLTVLGCLCEASGLIFGSSSVCCGASAAIAGARVDVPAHVANGCHSCGVVIIVLGGFNIDGRVWNYATRW